jgi:hypothetical protein
MISKVAFIDHNYHIKTKSGDFLRKILEFEFEIDNYWVGSDLKFEPKIFDYQNLFFFQILPPFKILKKLKGKNIIWAPMYDSPHHPYGYSRVLWKIIKYFDIKVLSFSKKITDQIKKTDISYLDLKFYKKTKYQRLNKKINILFWNRGDVTINDWIDNVNINLINKIYYLNLDGINKQNIDISLKKKFFIIKKKFLYHKDFLELISKCEIFVCSRKKEGIGMAQVEALSQGKYLLGFRDGTMEDYIVDDKIGFFFDKNNFLDIKNVLNFKNYRLNFNTKGYIKYQKNKKNILKLFKKNITEFKHSITFETLVLLFYLYKIFIRKFIFFFLKSVNKI